MRVLHFYRTSFPDTVGGIEQVINQIARGMAKLGIDTDVLSLTPERVSSTIEIDGYLAHRVPLDFQIASTGFSYSAYSRFKELASQADIIHYHFPWPFMDVMHFAAQVRKPTLVTYHSDIIRQKHLLKLYRPLMNRFLANVNQIVASSPNYLSTSDVLKKLSHKVKVIPYGLVIPHITRTAVPNNQQCIWHETQLHKKTRSLNYRETRFLKSAHIVLM